MNKPVSVTAEAGIVEIRLDRTEKKNALTGAMYRMMAAALTDGLKDDSVRAFLITAAGSMFCAGNDIGDFLHVEHDPDDVPAMRFIHALMGCTKPVVAAVHGAAVGIGTTMLLHCDLVYASPEASLSVPFVAMGLVPEAGSSLLMPRLLGMQRAARMLLLGEPMGAEEALQAGLLAGIVAEPGLREHARARAGVLAAKPPEALIATRTLMRGGQDELALRIAHEFEVFGRALKGAEAREAAAAFLEKRAPDFSKLRSG